MGRISQQRASRGSQRWLQHFVASSPGVLDDAIGLGRLSWLSPLAEDAFSEYRDQAFVDLLGLRLTQRSLHSFWPRGGPVWDGLAHAPSGACVLLEAKAHSGEMSSSCTASAPASVALNREASRETQLGLGLEATADWCQGFYQYANRLAHAYLLSELNGLPTELVFLCFIGDSDIAGPVSRDEWQVAIDSVHRHLGIDNRLPAYVRNVFVDVDQAGLPYAPRAEVRQVDPD